MDISEEPYNGANWRCPVCRGELKRDNSGLKCAGCGKSFPIVDDIPILVGDPAGYLRSELAAVERAHRDALLRRDLLAQTARDADLPRDSLERHKDVIGAEIARAETLLLLLAPAASALAARNGTDRIDDALGARRSGWSFDTLIPYLLRDWSNTPELGAATTKIGAALEKFLPDASGKTIAFAGCGAGGILVEFSGGFGRIVGFDLTLPILAAARRLLDAGTLDIAMPRIHGAPGIVSLRRQEPVAGPPVELVAMDACRTAFADGAVDCVVTSFLLDLIADPRSLADEIHRILAPGGLWINYGPAGSLDATWYFDQAESAAFFAACGFTVTASEAYRATYLDLSRDDPSSSYQSHVCYLTAALKGDPPKLKRRASVPPSSELPETVPVHFPGANLVQQQSLRGRPANTILLRHERVRGRIESLEIGVDTARVIALVDGQRTIRGIAELLKQRNPAQTLEETVRMFARYFDQGLLGWRDRN